MKSIQKIVETDIEHTPKSYRRAATQRLGAATFLLENSTYFLDAVYLAGYAAECSLKALILTRTPTRKRAAVFEEISLGAKAHNFDFLAGVLNRKRPVISDEPAESLKVVKHEWVTQLRYIGALIREPEARNFVRHVRIIHEWTERSM